MGQRDWVAWHDQYEDADSPLSQRLGTVVDNVKVILDARPPGRITLLSICAGDGRDVVAALHNHRRAWDVNGTLIELDPTLSTRARERLADAGLYRIAVRTADASMSTAYRDVAPADVVLACGVLGNVGDEDARSLIARMPSLCTPGGSVVWTRHRRNPDLTPSIQAWFAQAGFERGSFQSPGPDSWSVGVQRRSFGEAEPIPDDVRLFTFH